VDRPLADVIKGAAELPLISARRIRSLVPFERQPEAFSM
jgi:hypothetical protein